MKSCCSNCGAVVYKIRYVVIVCVVGKLHEVHGVGEAESWINSSSYKRVVAYDCCSIFLKYEYTAMLNVELAREIAFVLCKLKTKLLTIYSSGIGFHTGRRHGFLMT